MKKRSSVVGAAICCAWLAGALVLSACDDDSSPASDAAPGSDATPGSDSLAAEPAKNPALTGLAAPGSATVQPGSTPTGQFSFQQGTDETARALKDVYAAWTTAPRTAAQAKDLFAARLAALAKLKASPEPAAQSILDDLQRAPTGLREPFQSGMHLLGEFESIKGIAYLHGRALTALPTGKEAIDSEDHPLAIAVHLRRLAVDELGRLAVRGSTSAAAKLLDIVQHGELDVKRGAIWGYYTAKGTKQRWRAKREMARTLPLAERYLLNTIY